MDYDALEKLRELYAAVTLGNLATAERHIASEMITCPVCSGDGEVEAADYCNFDHKALGVQFYGIGTEFGAHEQLWTAVMANLPTLIDAIADLRARNEALVKVTARSTEGWENAVELGLIPPQHRNTATILADEGRAALAANREG